MDAVVPQVGAGIFRRRLHFVNPDARTITFAGLLYHVARCGAVTLVDPGHNPAWLWCPNCIRPGEAVA